MITENGLNAELDCVTACRPWYSGHDNQSINPLGFLIHDIEDQNTAGLSPSDSVLMVGQPGTDSGIMGDDWFDKPTTEASVHFGVYPSGVCQCGPLSLGCWGAGPAANGFLVQAEQSGMSAYNIAQWLTPAGRAQLANMAQLYAELCAKFGWSPHWATDAELRGCSAGDKSQGFGGACYHADISRVFPGTTDHTDPGLSYPGKAPGPYTVGQRDPGDLFMPLAQARWQSLTNPITPPITPTDWLTMATQQEVQAAVEAAVAAALKAQPLPQSGWAVFSPTSGGIGATFLGSRVWSGLGGGSAGTWAAFQAWHKAAGLSFQNLGRRTPAEIAQLAGKQV